MFSGIRRLQKPFARKLPEQVEDAVKNDKLDFNDAETEEALVSQVANLEELVNQRTAELEEAKSQLQQLAIPARSPDQTDEQSVHLTPAAGNSGEDGASVEGLFTQPNQGKGELAVPVEAEPAVEEENQDALATEAVEEEKEGETVAEEASEATADFFTYEEEENNPLTGLIASLSDVNAAELLEEAQEIKNMMREWRD